MRVASGVFLIIGILFCGSMFAQEPDIWKPLRFFEGEWKGQGEGKVGVSTGHQTFSFILGGNYLRIENRTVFEPQEGNPQSEIHEDQGFFSYDRTRKLFVLRQFHIEGFVNQYVMKPLADDGKTFVFTSESIENIPPGFRARLSYRILNENEFEQTFDLASPGQEFDCYSKGVMKRVAASQ